MDQRAEIRDFLATRRARITPQQAGLPFAGGNRRVPGLRREELAMLAGVSVDYYTRIERGALGGVSESVLHALAEALQLSEAERRHLRDLWQSSTPGIRKPRPAKPPVVRPALTRMVDAIDAPTVLQNRKHQILHANRLARALYDRVIEGPSAGNYARFIFLDDRSRDFYPDWERIADSNVATLRITAGADPFDREVTDLVGELSTRSDEFRRRWAAHDVHLHLAGVKRMRHHVVGELELAFEGLDVTADPALVIYTYTAEPGSSTEDALCMLDAWQATKDAEQAATDLEEAR